MTEIRLFLTILALVIVPGWAFLSVTRLWARWKTLQRWCVAIGLSIAFYPVLYYWARLIVQEMDLGVNKLIAILVIFGGIALWGLRKHLKEQFDFEPSEWIAIGVFLATLFTRVWFAHLHPYPAWSDSLHHTLLTQLTAQHGGLPYTLEPYEPVPLGMYHLGLYAISGAVQLLSQVPAHSALLWTAQVLNGLCTLGVFLILDRKVGRKAALVGSVVVGLLSFQPAWYVNWGRFTQVASQSIMLIGWLVTWEALSAWAQPGKRRWSEVAALTTAAALLTASVFLLHFRVAGFYLPLLLIAVIWELYQALRRRVAGRALAGIFSTGLAALVIAFPALFNALQVYLSKTLQEVPSTPLAENAYYNGATLDSIFNIGVRPWLFYLTAASLMFLLLRRSKFGWAMLFWLAGLWMIGNAYLLNIPALAFTNYGAVIIMYYLPATLVVGAAVEELFRIVPLRGAASQRALTVILLLAGFIGSHLRMADVEPYRYFMTDNDLAAMTWIRENTPPDAVFAINTYMWLGTSPHGTDGGYWIPYFTGRKTTTGTMLSNLGTSEYQEKYINLTRSLSKINQDFGEVANLCDNQVSYLYIGQVTNPSMVFGDLELAAQTLELDLKFNSGNVRIYQLCK